MAQPSAKNHVVGKTDKRQGSTPLVSAALNSSDFVTSINDKLLQKRSTRYVFFPYSDALCNGVPGDKIPRGRIHPITPQIRVDQANAIPVEVSIERTKHTATYLVDNVQQIAGGVVAMYSDRGAIEVQALFGLDIETFEEIGVNELIFGEELIDTAAAYRARFDLVEEGLKSLPAAVAQKVGDIITLLRASITRAEVHARRVASVHEGEMEKAVSGSPDAGSYLPHYDRRALRALEFASLPRRDEAIARMAQNQNQIQDVLPQLLQQAQAKSGLDIDALTALGRAMGEAIAEKMKESDVRGAKSDGKDPAVGQYPAVAKKSGKAKPEEGV